MRFTLGLKELPYKQEIKQVIYVEGKYDEEVNRLIEENYLNIREYYQSCGYEFCYIPMLIQNLCKDGALQYSAPYAKESDLEELDDYNFVLQYMLHPENRESIPPSLLFYHPLCWDNSYPEAKLQYRGVTISPASFEEDARLKGALLEIINDIEKNREPIFRFQKAPQFSIHEDDLAKAKEPFTADEEFDTESKILLEEIEERIKRLKQKGISAYILHKLIMDEREMPSRLQITKNYRVFMPDYNNIEIKMTPLPKAVFLLFLKHPEGIMFSYLPDFREELLDIYKKIKGPFFNETEARKSVWDVTDPLSNSINEKCSRIREAFVSQFDEHLAQYYFVVGKRGEPKKIALPRNLVKWDSD